MQPCNTLGLKPNMQGRSARALARFWNRLPHDARRQTHTMKPNMQGRPARALAKF
eukprot:CAMPEP_0117525310 /NCGR_PEP_ID=MMETSP0784-20121206/35703_1 /TAXON_ID=39447 /ORGANISM="" /LENGTH=54 /DNA_ID=CAMNT_0005321501 /DNA_START=80 /DNA_END=244 /DNA_ORIENTATION=-